MESMRGRKDARDEYKEEDVSTTISSEVARLRMRIARECEAMHRGLSGVAMVARHAFINEWYAALEASWQRLEELIGAEQASTLVCQTYFQMIEPNGGRADAAETATDDC